MSMTSEPPSTPPGSISPDEVNNLFPAIVQCFSVILFGYLSGRFGGLTAQQAKGIGTYITQFALPAVFFRAMVTMDLGGVNWMFIAAVSLSKLVMYIITIILCLLISRRANFGLAGIFSIFTTQTNDVALGLPILSALFPQYTKYIYLFAPAQLVLLNPISFLMLEWHKQSSVQHHRNSSVVSEDGIINSSAQHSTTQSSSEKRVWVWKILHVFKEVFLNPVVFMTILGLIFNFILHNTIPLVIDKILEVLATSFSATALFFLGNNMVGKMGKIDQRGIYTIGLLMIAKLLFLPFLTREMINILNAGVDQNETLCLSTFGFLYGGLPTAPTVFLFSNVYSIATDVIANSLVIGTFLSAPMMYVTARLITLNIIDQSTYDTILESTSNNIAILSVICCVWVLGIFLITRRIFRLPHTFTVLMLLHVFLSCVGLLLGRIAPSTIIDPYNQNLPLSGTTMDPHKGGQKATWFHYVQFATFFIGCTGARCWTTLLALSLAMLRVRSLCFLLRYRWAIILTGICTPPLVTGILLIISQGNRVKDIDPVFQYGKAQITTSLCVLIFNVVATIVLLIIQHRFADHSFSPYQQIQEELSVSANLSTVEDTMNRRSFEEDDDSDDISSSDPLQNNTAAGYDQNGDNRSGEHRRVITIDPEREPAPVPLTCASGRCSASQRHQCCRLLGHLHENQSGGPLGTPSTLTTGMQLHRHMALIIFLLLSMFFGIVLCIWRLVKESPSGIYIELEFLDSVFNFGQGFILFAIFGLDTELIIFPFVKRIRRLLYGGESLPLPDEDSLSPEITTMRDQFIRYHMAACVSEIVSDRRYRLLFYKNVFSGQDLVDWLVAVGLTSDRLEARDYGHRLLLARVIQHTNQQMDFQDAPWLYRFKTPIGNPEAQSQLSHQEPGLVPDIEDLFGDNSNTTMRRQH